jgi:methylenetetrahydrofolate--tRNA-(uracil-5-)-methyltransferase
LVDSGVNIRNLIELMNNKPRKAVQLEARTAANAEFFYHGRLALATIVKKDYKYLDGRGETVLSLLGQISGVEGYMESASSGILAGYNAARRIFGEEPILLPKITMMGALSQYICDESVKSFQPMGAAFGIIDPLEEKIRDKKERYQALAERSMEYFKSIEL